METLRAQVKEKKVKIFREKAMKKFGHEKGAISKAVNDAIDKWLDYEENKSAKRKLTASDIRGLFSATHESSIGAQKKAVKMFGEID
ncbi:MAG TPA: hypothetical protein VFF13_04385 [archaeon]|nr:hypothetical protein [archaeon]